MASDLDTDSIIQTIVRYIQSKTADELQDPTAPIALLCEAALAAKGFSSTDDAASTASSTGKPFNHTATSSRHYLKLGGGRMETIITITTPGIDLGLTYHIDTNEFVERAAFKHLLDKSTPSSTDVEAAYVSREQLEKFLSLFDKFIVQQALSLENTLQAQEVSADIKEISAQSNKTSSNERGFSLTDPPSASRS